MTEKYRLISRPILLSFLYPLKNFYPYCSPVDIQAGEITETALSDRTPLMKTGTTVIAKKLVAL